MLSKTKQKCILVVDDEDAIREVVPDSDRAMILDRGQIVHRATGAETDHASLRERYLGAPA